MSEHPSSHASPPPESATFTEAKGPVKRFYEALLLVPFMVWFKAMGIGDDEGGGTDGDDGAAAHH